MNLAGQEIRAKTHACCPFCGGHIDPVLAVAGAVLSRQQREILGLLRQSGPMTVGQLASALFDGDDRGGPDWADGIVTTAIMRMRKKFKRFKLPYMIVTLPGGGGYVLHERA